MDSGDMPKRSRRRQRSDDVKAPRATQPKQHMIHLAESGLLRVCEDVEQAKAFAVEWKDRLRPDERTPAPIEAAVVAWFELRETRGSPLLFKRTTSRSPMHEFCTLAWRTRKDGERELAYVVVPTGEVCSSPTSVSSLVLPRHSAADLNARERLKAKRTKKNEASDVPTKSKYSCSLYALYDDKWTSVLEIPVPETAETNEPAESGATVRRTGRVKPQAPQDDVALPRQPPPPPPELEIAYTSILQTYYEACLAESHPHYPDALLRTMRGDVMSCIDSMEKRVYATFESRSKRLYVTDI